MLLEIIQSTYTSILEKSIFDINEQDIAMLENINFQLAQIADFLEKHKNQVSSFIIYLLLHLLLVSFNLWYQNVGDFAYCLVSKALC